MRVGHDLKKKPVAAAHVWRNGLITNYWGCMHLHNLHETLLVDSTRYWLTGSFNKAAHTYYINSHRTLQTMGFYGDNATTHRYGLARKHYTKHGNMHCRTSIAYIGPMGWKTQELSNISGVAMVCWVSVIRVMYRQMRLLLDMRGKEIQDPSLLLNYPYLSGIPPTVDISMTLSLSPLLPLFIIILFSLEQYIDYLLPPPI
ncbi:unnamed protein product [Absidia cylindrospora]